MRGESSASQAQIRRVREVPAAAVTDLASLGQTRLSEPPADFASEA